MSSWGDMQGLWVSIQHTTAHSAGWGALLRECWRVVCMLRYGELPSRVGYVQGKLLFLGIRAGACARGDTWQIV